MAVGLILEFSTLGAETYAAVNKHLGIDMTTGAGNWPAGLLSHAGGPTAGGWAVLEVWESREAQHAFMESALGPALQANGVTGPPARAEFIDLAGYHTATA